MSNVVKEKSFAFEVRVVNLYKYLCNEKKEFVLSKQLLRCGTAIGALVREAEQAESKPDFVHKMAIALKEANETEYWILLLWETGYLNTREAESAINDNKERLKLLTRIINSTKLRNGHMTAVNYQLSTEYREISCFFAILHDYVDKRVKDFIL